MTIILFTSSISSAVLTVRGEMEMDAEYFKTGAAVNFMLQTDTPLSFEIGTDIRKRKLFTKVNMEKMVRKCSI